MAPFIPKLADQTAPLRALTKKGVPFEWNSSLQVFKNVKASICKDIALSHILWRHQTNHHPGRHIKLSKIGIGAALLQDRRPIALTETKQRYANIECELLAVVFSFECFHTCIQLRKTLCGWDWPQTPGGEPQEEPCQHPPPPPTSTVDVAASTALWCQHQIPSCQRDGTRG